MKALATNVVYCEHCHTLYQLEASDSKRIYGYLHQKIECPRCKHEIVLS